MEDIERSLGVSPINKDPQFKNERNVHENGEDELVKPMVFAHHKVVLHHFREALFDLQCAYPEIAATQQIECNQRVVQVKVVARLIFKAEIAVALIACLEVTVDGQIEEKQNVEEDEYDPLEI